MMRGETSTAGILRYCDLPMRKGAAVTRWDLIDGEIGPCSLGTYEGPGWTGWTTCLDVDWTEDKLCGPCSARAALQDVRRLMTEMASSHDMSTTPEVYDWVAP